jgi:photosystem II stability/assembly factor-like uncharacterized protein
MTRSHRAAVIALLSLLAAPTAAWAQGGTAPPALAAVTGYSGYAAMAKTPPAFQALRWRNVGPFRGGRVVAVTGDYADPRVFYFGAVNGGVWKTANGGQTWSDITDGKSDISSVGAIAVAPSDPNVIWVGTGESAPREDLTYGTGVYRTTDGGDTWQHLGLTETQQIGDIAVDPADPERAFVAAMGHAFGPNPERGVYRTEDGGTTWTKVLYLDANTGAVDLSLDSSNPRVIYAAMWKYRRSPWGLDTGGGRSGLYRSLDGGDTWTDVSANPGLPRTPLGRIGVVISPANPRRIYASVEAPDSAGEARGGIFRSDDAGATWTRVNGDWTWQIRAWYFSGITADPQDENTVYLQSLYNWRSVDGGEHWTRFRTPHDDNHILWIDPADPQRMIHGSDGGATVSYDGGTSWSTLDNQPTAQFYHVITDDQWPYRIYGAQQDNTTVSIVSRSQDGAIGERDWYPVAGGESAHIAVDPRNPDITYGGLFEGAMFRHDHGTGQDRDISIDSWNYDGMAAADVPNRFAWTFPVLLSPHDPNTLYIASQYVWRSTDEGYSFEKISPDLSVADPATLGKSGGPIHYDMTGTEWYASVYTLAESPLTAGLLWAGSDDGLVHLTRDGGEHWTDVTPPGLKPFTRMSVIEPGRHDDGTAYLAANRYQQDDFTPYLFKTRDFGKTWTTIASGLPQGAYARTIREDPVHPGLLYAGTEVGVYVSLDDGAHWQPLQLNLPRSSVRDLNVHGADLVAATHGRAFWALDDVSLLRQLADSVTDQAAFLFQPEPAVRALEQNPRKGPTVGENPPHGAIIDYWLRDEPTDSVTLEILDAGGNVVRTFSSQAADTSGAADSTVALRLRGETVPREYRRRGDPVDTAAFVPADSIVPTRPGTNRFVWNFRYPAPKQVKGIVIDLGTGDGPEAVPGDYTVRLTVDGRVMERPLKVLPDPRLHMSHADLVAQFDAVKEVTDRIDQIARETQHLLELKGQMDDRVGQTSKQPYADRVHDATRPLQAALDSVHSALDEVYWTIDYKALHYPVRPYNQLLNMNLELQAGHFGPTEAQTRVIGELGAKVDVQIARLREIESVDIARLNDLLEELGVPPIYVPRPIS